MLKFSTKAFARSGVIAALYTVLSLIVFPISSGAIQFRISEGLTMLALIFPEAILSLTIGCLLSNLITGCALFDVIFGSLITFMAAILTHVVGKTVKNTVLKLFVGGIFPVLLNAFLLPLIWIWCYGTIEYVYYLQVLLLVLGQSLSVYLVGVPIYSVTKKLKEKGISFLK